MVNTDSSFTHVIRCADRRVCKLPAVCFPGGNVLLASHCEVDGIDHNRVARLLAARGRVTVVGDVSAAEQLLVVCRVVLLVEAGRESEIRQLDVARLVDQNVIRLNVSETRSVRCSSTNALTGG